MAVLAKENRLIATYKNRLLCFDLIMFPISSNSLTIFVVPAAMPLWAYADCSILDQAEGSGLTPCANLPNSPVRTPSALQASSLHAGCSHLLVPRLLWATTGPATKGTRKRTLLAVTQHQCNLCEAVFTMADIL